MGADFVWIDADVTESKETWLKRLTHDMDAESIQSFIEATEPEIGWWRFDDEETDMVEFVTEYIKDSINTAYDYMYNREMGWYMRNGYTYVLTGGMSWGDDPTDAFEYIGTFRAFQDWYNSVPIK